MPDSNGTKRLIAAFLSSLLEVLRAIPAAANFVSVIELVAGFFGITGISHAVLEKTVATKKLASFAAILAAVVALAQFVPQLQPFLPFLQRIAALLGSGAMVAEYVN